MSALIRLGRVLVAQAIAWVIAEWGGLSIPYVPLTIGAVISGVAKYLREKYGWTWLPV